MSLYDQHIFLLGPLVLLNVRIKVVVPSINGYDTTFQYLPFSTLFTDSSGKCERNLTPIHGAQLGNHVNECVILLLSPGALYHGWIKHLLPPMQTLNVCPALKEGRYSLPVFCLK